MQTSVVSTSATATPLLPGRLTENQIADRAERRSTRDSFVSIALVVALIVGMAGYFAYRAHLLKLFLLVALAPSVAAFLYLVVMGIVDAFRPCCPCGVDHVKETEEALAQLQNLKALSPACRNSRRGSSRISDGR
jgi:hypothetical protein